MEEKDSSKWKQIKGIFSPLSKSFTCFKKKSISIDYDIYPHIINEIIKGIQDE